MKKKIFLLALLVVLINSLVACGKKENKDVKSTNITTTNSKSSTNTTADLKNNVNKKSKNQIEDKNQTAENKSESIYDLPKVSEEEYIKIYANRNHISIEQAKEEIEQKENEYLNNLATRILEEKVNRTTRTPGDFKILNEDIKIQLNGLKDLEDKFYNNNMTKDDLVNKLRGNGYFSNYKLEGTETYRKNPNFSAKVSADLRLYTSGSFGEIVDVEEIWSEAVSGTNNYEWIQGGQCWSDPRVDEIRNNPSIYITVYADGYFKTTTTGSIGAGAGIPGFNVSTTIGNQIIYISDPMMIQKSFRTMN